VLFAASTHAGTSSRMTEKRSRKEMPESLRSIAGHVAVLMIAIACALTARLIGRSETLARGTRIEPKTRVAIVIPFTKRDALNILEESLSTWELFPPCESPIGSSPEASVRVIFHYNRDSNSDSEVQMVIDRVECAFWRREGVFQRQTSSRLAKGRSLVHLCQSHRRGRCVSDRSLFATLAHV